MEVIKGGAGAFFLVPFFTFCTVYCAPSRSARIWSACCFVPMLNLPCAFPYSDAVKVFLLPFGINFASIDQYSSGLNARISSSLSTMILTATDCTLPAESPLRIFWDKNGLSLYPTRRSKILLACCASTRSLSIALGCSMPVFTPVFVISLNSTRLFSSSSNPSKYAKCQEIASPSRSGSVARYTQSEACAAFFNSSTSFSLPLMTSYLGAKWFLTSTLKRVGDKSRICPIEAITL